MAAQFEDIKLKLQPAGTLKLPWRDFEWAVILINNWDILDIAAENEYENFMKQLCELAKKEIHMGKK